MEDRKPGRGPGRPPSPFGVEVRALMARRGIGTARQLSQKFGEAGDPLTHQSISNYLSGKTKASPEFARTLARIFDLTEEEKTRLAYVMVFGD